MRAGGADHLYSLLTRLAAAYLGLEASFGQFSQLNLASVMQNASILFSTALTDTHVFPDPAIALGVD